MHTTSASEFFSPHRTATAEYNNNNILVLIIIICSPRAKIIIFSISHKTSGYCANSRDDVCLLKVAGNTYRNAVHNNIIAMMHFIQIKYITFLKNHYNNMYQVIQLLKNRMRVGGWSIKNL